MNFSISKIKLFKACRRAYELKYVYGLEPVNVPDALQTGLTYHSKLEELYEHGDIDASDSSKESAMVMAYKKYVYPNFRMKNVEQWVRYPLTINDSLIQLVGRVDGIADDGMLVEHKTTSAEIGEDYEYALQWDEQILAYMLMTGARKMWYTVCRKPTIRLKKDETEEEFFLRMVDWYDEDTESKIKLLQVERTDDEIDVFQEELQEIVKEMLSCRTFYRNCSHCQRYGRWCEYAPVCLNYDPFEEYIGFRKEVK